MNKRKNKYIYIYETQNKVFKQRKPERVNKENKSGNEKQQTQNVNKQIQYRQTNRAKIPKTDFISTEK